MKRLIIRIITGIIYIWGSIWYDKKYFVGKNFSRDHFSNGWTWILKYWFPQKIIGYGRKIPFPIPRGVIIGNVKNIEFDSDDMRNFHTHGTYFQGVNGKILKLHA